MPILLNSLSPDQFAEQIGEAALTSLPLHVQPRFLALSVDYLNDNAHLIERAGHASPRAQALYTSFTDEQGRTHYLPCLRLRAVGLRIDLVPAPDLRRAIWPGPVDEMLIREVCDKLTLRRWLWCAEVDMGWDLRPSLLQIFSGFSDDERAAMCRRPERFELEMSGYEEGRAELQRYRQAALDHKEEVGVAVIERDHDRLAQVFADELQLARVCQHGEAIGMLLWTEHGADAIWVEWVGDARFRRDHMLGQIVLRLFGLLKQRGLRRLHAAGFEWFLPLIWQKIIEAEDTDPQRVRHHQRLWGRLEARGIEDLNR